MPTETGDAHRVPGAGDREPADADSAAAAAVVARVRQQFPGFSAGVVGAVPQSEPPDSAAAAAVVARVRQQFPGFSAGVVGAVPQSEPPPADAGADKDEDANERQETAEHGIPASPAAVAHGGDKEPDVNDTRIDDAESLSFGDGGSDDKAEDGDDAMAMAFQLGRNTGATGGLSHPWFDGSDYLRPKPKDAGRDRERKWVFQKRNAKDHSEVEEGEDFSEVAGFDKASHRRNHGKNGNLLGLDDIAKVSTVEMNNQSRDCSDEVLKKIKDRGDWNDDNNPNKSERNLSGTPSTRFAIDVLTNEDGAFDTNGGKWKRVWEGYRIADTCGMIGIWLNYLYNMAQGDEKLLPQKESGSGKEIMDKFIKVTALETDVRQEDRDDDNLHKPTTEDKRILSEAKEAMRSLVCPENKLVITDLGGCFLGKYPGFEQFGKGSSVRVTRGQLDPYETFETGGHITEEKCAWSSDGRRCVYTRNSKPEPGYVELWSEDIHGKWSDIEVGVRNPAHGSIPEETIKGWGDMTKRKRGGQSKGGVYKLDIERREVIEYKDYWSAFGYANGRKGIKVGDVVNAGRGGKELDGNLYVHESQCKEKTYVEGDILPLKAPVVQP